MNARLVINDIESCFLVKDTDASRKDIQPLDLAVEGNSHTLALNVKKFGTQVLKPLKMLLEEQETGLTTIIVLMNSFY